MANLNDLPRHVLPEHDWEITAEMLQDNPHLLEEVMARSRRQRSAYIQCQTRRLLETLRADSRNDPQTASCA